MRVESTASLRSRGRSAGEKVSAVSRACRQEEENVRRGRKPPPEKRRSPRPDAGRGRRERRCRMGSTSIRRWSSSHCRSSSRRVQQAETREWEGRGGCPKKRGRRRKCEPGGVACTRKDRSVFYENQRRAEGRPITSSAAFRAKSTKSRPVDSRREGKRKRGRWWRFVQAVSSWVGFSW